jgi:hypothetical protein
VLFDQTFTRVACIGLALFHISTFQWFLKFVGLGFDLPGSDNWSDLYLLLLFKKFSLDCKFLYLDPVAFWRK